MHCVAPYGEKVPAGQITGRDPSGTHLLPAGHILHMGLPGLVEYVPLIQSAHSVALNNEKVPVGQIIGLDPPGTHLLPAGHISHMKLPGLVEYMPLIHSVHSVAPNNEKVPAGQITGGDPSGMHLLPIGHGGQSVPLYPLTEYVPLSHMVTLCVHDLPVGQTAPVTLHWVFGGHWIGIDNPPVGQ